MPDWTLPDVSRLSVGVLGGTGDQGRGLGRRFAAAGHRVVLGSRDPARAAAAAAATAATVAAPAAPAAPAPPAPPAAPAALDGPGDPTAGPMLTGAGNEAAADADVVIVAVPWEGHRDLLTALAARLAGRIVVDCVNPIGFDDRGAYPLPVPEGSAAEQAAALLPDSRVVAAFHHLSAVPLLDPNLTRIDADVLVLGDDRGSTDVVQALAGRIPGVRGIYAGRLRNSSQVEALTANLISMNRRYRAHAGVRITDL